MCMSYTRTCWPLWKDAGKNQREARSLSLGLFLHLKQFFLSCAVWALLHTRVCVRTHTDMPEEKAQHSCWKLVVAVVCFFPFPTLAVILTVFLWATSGWQGIKGLVGEWKGAIKKITKIHQDHQQSKFYLFLPSPPHHPPTPQCHPAHNLMLWKYGPIQSHILWLSSRDCLFAEWWLCPWLAMIIQGRNTS